ncbi:hypothetical protein IJ579_01790 [bacterium]|nr:hypothetical protein [bacterium]
MSSLSVSPITFKQSYVQQPTLANKASSTAAASTGPRFKDCTDLYTEKEIRDILKQIGTDNDFTNRSRYQVFYYPNKEALVIHNTSLTNDTTEIYKDGSVKHVGSWHNKDVAPAGTFNDIIEDAKKRYEASTN